MRLFLVARHGQSLFNVDKVVNGDPEIDRGLSEQGIEEAERLAGQLAPLPLDVVAVSPFPRALQTANIALAGREVPHVVDDDLGDVRIGELEGESLDAYRAAPAHTNRKERFPGGESLDEAALRYADAFDRSGARKRPRSSSATRSRCAISPTRPRTATT
jgi:probable phosphoglycerate mutase